MAKPTFHLKDPRADKDTAIFLLYTCADGRLKYYTGESIHPDNWPTATKPIRAVLNRITDLTNSLQADYKIKGDHLTKQELRAHLDKLKIKPVKQSSTFSEMETVLVKMRTGIIVTPKNKRYAPGTIRAINHALNTLKKFKPGMRTVTMETYKEFISWCHREKYSTNYIGALIKNWKTLGGHSGHAIYSNPDFKIISEDATDVYLDEKELEEIYKVKTNHRESVARDWFLIGCYTGLRVSDLTRLSKKNYKDGFITISNEKTDEKVTIPAHPIVKSIIKKYKGFPPKVTDVEINRSIKKVAKKAEINGSVLVTITKGGVRVDKYKQKWEMISSHTARRSLITNLLRAGVSDSLVMKLTGIKSHATAKRYNKMSSEEAAKIMSQHEFFK